MRGSAILALAAVLAACGSGTQGPPGPAGPAGTSGNADPTQVVVLGTAPQAGSFHVTGPVYVGSVETSRVTFGPGAAERLDAVLVSVLTGGESADGLHTHAASALTGTLPAAALPPEAAQLVSGKLPDSVLSASVPLLVSSRLPASVLPASVPLLDGTGKLPASLIPADYALVATVFTRTESDARYATAGDLASIGSQLSDLRPQVLALQAAESGRTLTAQSANVEPGQCVVVYHGWNTTAVMVGAWERRPERSLFVPWADWRDDGTTDAARGRTPTASPDGGALSLATDGNPATQWEGASPTVSVTLDLGRLRRIEHVRFRPSSAGATDPTTTNVFLWWSQDGGNWNPVGGYPCTPGATCDQLQDVPVGVAGRYLKLDLQGLTAATLADLEVYGEGATVSAAANAVTLCNYDSFSKELSVRVSR